MSSLSAMMRSLSLAFMDANSYWPQETLVQRTPLVLVDVILPVSSAISQARLTSVHHSLFSGPLASPMNLSVSSLPCTQEMVNSTPDCGGGTISASTTS